MEERLQKVLAQAGVASRREAEEYITAGRVKVALPNDSNKQQETYADMTNRSATNDKAGMFCHTHRHLLLTLVLSRFESCEVSVHQTQSVNKRYQYV